MEVVFGAIFWTGILALAMFQDPRWGGVVVVCTAAYFFFLVERRANALQARVELLETPTPCGRGSGCSKARPKC